MSLLFNMLSRLVITFLPRSKHLLISWLQSPSAVILEPPQKNKVSHCFHCFPIYLPWSDGTGCKVSIHRKRHSWILVHSRLIGKKQTRKSQSPEPELPAGEMLPWEPRQGPAFPGGSESKECACNAGDLGLTPGWGRSSEEGNGYPLYGEFQGQRRLEGYSPWCRKESDTTEQLTLKHFYQTNTASKETVTGRCWKSQQHLAARERWGWRPWEHSGPLLWEQGRGPPRKVTSDMHSGSSLAPSPRLGCRDSVGFLGRGALKEKRSLF